MPRVLMRPWLDSYLDYVKETENPSSYNMWSGISALSSTLKRRVHLWYHQIKFFPNQYIILVGPPGLGKGSSIKPAVHLAKEAATVNYLSDRITAEKIIDTIAVGFNHPITQVQGNTVNALVQTEHTATILAKELPVFLGSSDWMHSLLCQLWDENEFEHQTKNKGSKFIKDMCVGMLGGCVPEYIRRLTKDTLAPVTGGFTARCIFVYATKKSQLLSDGWGAPNGNHGQLETDLVNDLKYISSIEGEMHLTNEAKKLWDTNYANFSGTDEFESDALANFKSRIPSHVIKLAITLSISESDALIITEKQLQQAITLIEEVRDNVDITFRAVGESPLAAAQDRVMRFIEARGAATSAEILKYNHKHITSEQLISILIVLESIGFCTQSSQGGRMIYKHDPDWADKLTGVQIKGATP